jgi:hypothetical protein
VRAAGQGFTVVEALVAIVILTVGVLALVGTAAQVTRSIGQGRHATLAAAVAAGRVAELRRIARLGTPPCSAAEWRSDSAVESGIPVSWQVLDAAGAARRVQVIVRRRSSRSIIADSVITAVLCEAS